MRVLFVRELSAEEKRALQQGLHSLESFTVRRCQILLSSAGGKTASQIAESLHCSDQCVRNAIHAFNEEGLTCLQEKSHARGQNQSAFDATGLERLREMIRLSPRTCGYETSLWRLELLAKTCWDKGITSRPVSIYSVSRALKQVGIRWSRAKDWIKSPDENYGIKKRRDWLKERVQVQPEWMLVEEDECWFSRFVQPKVHAWVASGEQLRLVQREIRRGGEQRAIACYGVQRQDNGQRLLYLCDGQPNSDYTILVLKRLIDVARGEYKRVLVVIWDRASWHKSKKLRQWVSRHNLQAKRQGDVRILIYRLPSKSPWLNPMEPCWIHAKRKVCEPEGELTVEELKRRLCAHFQVALSTATLKSTDAIMH